MQASELRIGNIINFPIYKENGNVDYEPRYISKISIFYAYGTVFQGKKFCESPISKLLPIPLSEQILLDCEIQDWIINNRFECRHNFNDSVSIYAWKNGKSIFIIDLFYLHELQNWYILHAKQELEYKPN